MCLYLFHIGITVHTETICKSIDRNLWQGHINGVIPLRKRFLRLNCFWWAVRGLPRRVGKPHGDALLTCFPSSVALDLRTIC